MRYTWGSLTWRWTRVVWLICAGFAHSVAQDMEVKLDTVISNQKKMMDQQKEILGHVKPSEPLSGKTAGVEFNPALALLGSAEGATLSGGVSLFSMDRNAEIAVPVFYQSDTKDDYQNLIVDVHYRRFIGGHQKGFFISGGARYQRLHGNEGEAIDFEDSGRKATANKLGLMCGIGYRYFTQSGFYWGTSLSVGRYFTDTDKKFESHFGISEKLLWDFELLKIGYAF